MKKLEVTGYGYTYEAALEEALESVSELGCIVDVKLVDVSWLETKRFACVFEITWY